MRPSRCLLCGVLTMKPGTCTAQKPCPETPKWKIYSQYMTNPKLANRIAVWMGADEQRLTVIDPTCGTGTLLAPWVLRGHQCTGVDIDPDMVHVAKRRFGHDARVFQGDYRTMRQAALGTFNPPYENQMDAKVIAHAMARVDRGVCLIRLDCLSLQYWTEEVFAVARPQRIAHLRWRPLFDIPADDVTEYGAQRPFVVIDLVHDRSGFAGGRIETEWWSR